MPTTDLGPTDPWRRSLERSRSRRAAAASRARRKLRSRGATVSLVSVLAVSALGAPLAIGHSTGSGEAVAPASATYLTTGSSGSAVSAVQSALGVAASGYFDKATLRAVRSFQSSNGLVVDGIVGPQTSAALGLTSGASQQSAPKPQKPAPVEQAPTSQPSSGGQSSSGGGSGGGGSAPSGALQQIAQCESGGDPTATNGEYRGKYQFTQETWAGVGGSGDPAAASEAEQDRRAAQLYAQQGSSPWANCAG